MDKLTTEKIAELLGPETSILEVFNTIQKQLRKAGAAEQNEFSVAPPFSGRGYPNQHTLETRTIRNT